MFLSSISTKVIFLNRQKDIIKHIETSEYIWKVLLRAQHFIYTEQKVPSKRNESRVVVLQKVGHKNKKAIKIHRSIALIDTVEKISARY